MAAPKKHQADCSVDDCVNKSVARGWCTTHWARWKRTGSPTGLLKEPHNRTKCSTEYCEKAPRNRLNPICDACYMKEYRHGSVYGGRDAPQWKRGPYAGCWEWTGTIDSGGYGILNGKRLHRLVYEAIIGDIPDGLVVRHMCHNRSCYNPNHLKPGTSFENAMDKRFAGRDFPYWTLDVRPECASLMLNGGMNIPEIAQVLQVSVAVVIQWFDNMTSKYAPPRPDY